jgi:hypothetical protein
MSRPAYPTRVKIRVPAGAAATALPALCHSVGASASTLAQEWQLACTLRQAASSRRLRADRRRDGVACRREPAGR